MSLPPRIDLNVVSEHIGAYADTVVSFEDRTEIYRELIGFPLNSSRQHIVASFAFLQRISLFSQRGHDWMKAHGGRITCWSPIPRTQLPKRALT